MEKNIEKIINIVKTNIEFSTNYDLNLILRQPNVFIITDETIFKTFFDLFISVENKTIVLSGSKDYKTFEYFSFICNELTVRKANKNSRLFGIGGGSITDLTGLVASVYLRGIEVNFVPTTLMGMVDASIGGKNSIDISYNKNTIGSYHLPMNVYINTMFLKSLNSKDILSGFAEIIKTGLLFDFQLLNDSLFYLDKIGNVNLNMIILKCINHKIKVISEDLFCNGNRNFLNFGHTIGHLIEHKYNLSHGFAVAYGMIFETYASVKLSYTNIAIYNEILRIISNYYTPNFAEFQIQDIIDSIYLDKKISCEKIKFPIIKELGRGELVEIDLSELINCFKLINFKNGEII